MVLACYDGSDAAKRAIGAAHDLLGDVELTVVHVWDVPAGLFVPDPFGGMESWTAAQVSELDTVIRERAGRLLSEGVTAATEAGFKAQGRLEQTTGSAWRTIVEVADELDAKLIVLGSHGRSGVESALLGSVSTAVMHHAKRPVLVVPADATSSS
jgi:nucleotide-binding universal stress UspA family protein